MDFIFASAVRAYAGILFVLASYDIACQWFVNLWSRVDKSWPEELKIPRTVHITPAVPSFDFNSHKTEKHYELDPRTIVGKGVDDNVGIERIWSRLNGLGPATKFMGPETRHFVINNHIGSWNRPKYIGHGTSLLTPRSQLGNLR